MHEVVVCLTKSGQNKKMIKISSNSFYYVGGLTYSAPYLVSRSRNAIE